jgi:hypothetical protein
MNRLDIGRMNVVLSIYLVVTLRHDHILTEMEAILQLKWIQ